MSLADKLAYLIGTKTAIRDALNESGARIDESLPFRQYAGWIDWLNYSRANELRSLFANGETGTLASDLPYFVDVEGNTPATWGDPVGLIRDASPNRADFTQPTVTARPILGRVPRGGRRNLLRDTGDMVSGWSWNSNSLVRGVEAPDGTSTAIQITTPESSRQFLYLLPAAPTPGTYTISIWVYFETLVAPFSFQLAYYNGGSSVASSSVTITEDMVGEWHRIDNTITVTETPSSPQIRFHGYSTGAEGNVYRVWHPQLEMGAEATPYQQVTNEYDITEEGVEDIHYLSFDLTDDNLTTTLPAIENGTLVIAGTNGIWIDDDYNFAGGTFSIGPNTYSGGPTGLLNIIGSPLVGGALVIDRQLTPAEKGQVIAFCESKGSPGLIELGPERISDEGWAPSNSSAVLEKISDGEFKITGSAQHSGARHLSGLPLGAAYLLDYEFRNGTSNACERLGPPGEGNSNTWSAHSYYTRQTRTGVTTTQGIASSVLFRTGSLSSGGEVFFRNVSLRQIILPGDTP